MESDISQRIGFDVSLWNQEKERRGRSQLRSLDLEHAHHRTLDAVKVVWASTYRLLGDLSGALRYLDARPLGPNAGAGHFLDESPGGLMVLVVYD